jgi:hypothetical protein
VAGGGPCDGEEGGEGELDAPQTKNGERGLDFAHRGLAHDNGGGRTATVGVLGQRWSASNRATARSKRALSGRARRGCARRFRQRRQRGRNGAVGTPAPTVLLTCWSGAGRGSHVATVRCQVGPTRQRFPNLKSPRMKIAQNK